MLPRQHIVSQNQEEIAMGMRNPGYVMAMALGCGVLCAGAAFAQDSDFRSLGDFGSLSKPALPPKLADVPEVHFQQPLARAMKPDDAKLHIKRTIDRVHALNQKKTDAFMETLVSKRPDLAGLSFAMGDACRMKEDASRQFVASLADVRQAYSFFHLNLSEKDREKLRTEISNVSNRLQSPYAQLYSNSGREMQELIVRVFRRWLEALDYQVKLKETGMSKVDALISMPGPAIDLMDYFPKSKWAQWQEIDPSVQVAMLMQVFAPGNVDARRTLVQYLDGLAHADATRALAKLAIFSEEPEIRAAAVRALRMRRDRDYTAVLLAGLKYPWPAVAERSSAAIVKLGRTDLVPHLTELLKGPDPRAPQTRESSGKKVSVVRELVRINHHHNCLLCHAPATASRDKASPEETAKLEKLTAQIPIPGEAITAYYAPSNPDILVRFDVTYLRQDFSLTLPVKDAVPWPEMQRYDFLVRTREVTDQEVLAYRELLPANNSPYQRAALSALRELKR